MKINLLQKMDFENLALFIHKQLQHLFLEENENHLISIQKYIPQSLNRMRVLVNSVRVWDDNIFDTRQSTQYCIFLYLLSNTIFKETEKTELPTLLFLLNKSLNAIDLFYEIELPEIFFISHSVGIVFAKAKYSNYFAIYQNSTVGRNQYGRPTIEEGVILYPNSSIIGNSHIQKNTLISSGIHLINQHPPKNCLVLKNAAGGGRLLFKPLKNLKHIEEIFKI